MKMFSKLGLLTLLFSFLSLSCSKEDINKSNTLKTSTSADWGDPNDCPYCLPKLDLIKRIDNKGANVVLGNVEVCRTETALCFAYTARAGSELGSIKIGLFATFDDLYNRNNNPSPKNFTVTRNLQPKQSTYTECIPVATILSVLGLASEAELYNPANMAKLYITAEAQVSGGQEGGQAWAGTRVGNGKYPFDRYFVYQFAGCNNPPKATCTYTQGFWKNHGPNPSGNNSNEWDLNTQLNGMTLGSVTYTADQLQMIFETPVKGNGLISLAHQLIAAKLNIANGADGSAVAGAIAAADALIGGLVIPPVGGGYLAPKTTSALTTALANYNEGKTGPGHCD
jgi:hypothetical protein